MLACATNHIKTASNHLLDQMNQLIQKATVRESEELSELTLKSNAYWSYSKEQLEEWYDDLQISEEYINDNEVFITKENDQITGYYSFKYISGPTVKLDNIFIEPKYIGKGVRNNSNEGFLRKMKELKISTITLDSEPDAERFYRKFGFRTGGQLKTSIPDRFLPIMELNLNR